MVVVGYTVEAGTVGLDSMLAGRLKTAWKHCWLVESAFCQKIIIIVSEAYDAIIS